MSGKERENPENDGGEACCSKLAERALNAWLMKDRSSWLHEVHERAESLIAAGGFEVRCGSFLGEPPRGRRQMDKISGHHWYLRALLAVTNPKKVLGLGQCLGNSTTSILGGLATDAMLISTATDEPASPLRHRAGDSRLRSLTGNDLAQAISEGIDLAGVDFLFMDTDHTYTLATKEWETYRRFLADNALVVFDDITVNDMGRFWDELACAKLATGASHCGGFGLAAP